MDLVKSSLTKEDIAIGITPELLEAIEQQRIDQAKRIKEASLGAKIPKIVDKALSLATARHMQSKRQLITKLNKLCVSWLKEEAVC